MEAKQLKRDVEALIGDYIGQKLREISFDPKGKGTSTMLDDLAHYDLAISVALWWLDKEAGRSTWWNNQELHSQYPNRLEREAMILSSFAGMIMVSLFREKVLFNPNGSIVVPFTLSYHPFAMLGSYRAVHHCRKHSESRITRITTTTTTIIIMIIILIIIATRACCNYPLICFIKEGLMFHI
uniref:Uncharacterized protein n=1 Tax=Acanthochromis polyacanthus TaxID=80966 RepID=A0A3Q1FGI1_9TELE